MKADVVVLGAGMVGVGAALHLQRRGREVVLLDRRGAGEETSYGNAGLIERSSVVPRFFPRAWGDVLRYALNGTPEAYYQMSSLPSVLPWLARYFLASSPARVRASSLASLPLIENCLIEHKVLMAEAGATDLMRPSGWLRLAQTPAGFDLALAESEQVRRDHGIQFDMLDRAGVEQLEPHLTGNFVGAIHLTDPGAVINPGALVKAYAALFVRNGGPFVHGDAATLKATGDGWTVQTDDGPLTAREVVVALGPWSDDLLRPLGVRLPLGIKRGYHLHFRPRGNAVLNHPVLDIDNGFLLAPMQQGIRLTTGAEFARRDAPPSPVPIRRTTPLAKNLFPLGEAVETTPWMGARPCFPDMLPVIGRAPGVSGMWLDFGHQHHGFTLGPVSGRLLAEMMTGETPFTDPTPYRAERFG